MNAECNKARAQIVALIMKAEGKDGPYAMTETLEEMILRIIGERDIGRGALSERDKLQAEVKRLQAGGCARDQKTTQFCAEAVALKDEVEALKDTVVRLAHACPSVPRVIYPCKHSVTGYCGLCEGDLDSGKFIDQGSEKQKLQSEVDRLKGLVKHTASIKSPCQRCGTPTELSIGGTTLCDGCRRKCSAFLARVKKGRVE